MRRYFTILEIVGFESFIKNNPTTEVDILYRGLTDEIRKGLAEYKAGLEGNKSNDFNVQLYSLGKYLVLIEDDDRSASLYYVTWATQMTIALALSLGFPVVGCVHCGSFSEEGNPGPTENDALNFLFLGTAYWEALSAVEVAPAMGCMITGAAQNIFEEKRTKNTYTIDDLVHFHLLAKIPVQGIDEPAIAINWMADTRLNFSRKFLSTFFEKHNKNTDERTDYLIDNTMAFIAAVQAERLN